jgi:superkiller protein 3
MPASEEGLGNLANVLLLQGHTEEAVAEYRKLLQLDPDSPEGHIDLSAALLRQGRMDEAIAQAQKAVELARHTDDAGEGHNDAMMLGVLAGVYAKAGRYPEAIAAGKMALQRARSQSNATLVAALTRELASYQAGSKPSP